MVNCRSSPSQTPSVSLWFASFACLVGKTPTLITPNTLPPVRLVPPSRSRLQRNTQPRGRSLVRHKLQVSPQWWAFLQLPQTCLRDWLEHKLGKISSTTSQVLPEMKPSLSIDYELLAVVILQVESYFFSCTCLKLSVFFLVTCELPFRTSVPTWVELTTRETHTAMTEVWIVFLLAHGVANESHQRETGRAPLSVLTSTVFLPSTFSGSNSNAFRDSV